MEICLEAGIKVLDLENTFQTVTTQPTQTEENSTLAAPRIHSIFYELPNSTNHQIKPNVSLLQLSLLKVRGTPVPAPIINSRDPIPVTPEATADSQTRPPVSHQSAKSPLPERTADTQDQRWRRSRSRNFSKSGPTIYLHDSTKPNFGTERNLVEKEFACRFECTVGQRKRI